jgi:hypothetical protein
MKEASLTGETIYIVVAFATRSSVRIAEQRKARVVNFAFFGK